MDILNPQIEPYFFLSVILLVFISIYKNWFKPADSFLYAVILFLITGILTPAEAFSGLQNPSILSIVLLILITAGIKNSFNLEEYITRIFSRVKSYRGYLLLMMSNMAVVSSFINNTPVVALMTPYVVSWGKKHKISPSKLLIPLSFATVVGGMITLIGTSTTLVLNGLILEVGGEGYNNLDLMIIGLPVAVCTILTIALISKWFLPDKKDILSSFVENKREYLIEKRLNNNSSLIGKTVKEGGLRNLKGVYLVEIVRNNRSITPVPRSEVIEPHDILIFAGKTEDILSFDDEELGMTLPKPVHTLSGQVELIEVVVSSNSSIIGQTIKDSDFRNRYDAAVVAVHRGSERLGGKIGDITLQAGDVLLLYAGNDFESNVEVYQDLLIISEERKKISTKKNQQQLIILVSLLAFLLITRLFSLFVSLLIIAAAMVALQMITVRNLKRDLDFSMVIILVFSIALGEAMINTGAGQLLSELLLGIFMPYGPLSILIGLALITTLLTSFVSNVGAAAIIFPIAYSISYSMEIDPMPFYLVIAYAASAAFLTPISYQTNLMVYGPGGYNFRDFLRIGVPVTIVYLSVMLIVIALLYSKTLGL